MAATVWPESTYELDAGLGLTVCVAHKGEHPWYMHACVAFQRGRQPKALRIRLTRQDRPPVVERPEPIQVQLDESKLAAGIAIALDQLMQKRRQERAPEPVTDRKSVV